MKKKILIMIGIHFSVILLSTTSFANTKFICKGYCQKVGAMLNNSFVGVGIGPTAEEAFAELAKFCRDTKGENGEQYGLVLPNFMGNFETNNCHQFLSEN